MAKKYTLQIKSGKDVVVRFPMTVDEMSSFAEAVDENGCDLSRRLSAALNTGGISCLKEYEICIEGAVFLERATEEEAVAEIQAKLDKAGLGGDYNAY
jgi:hypothetical protein